jgi:hypothetical protein
MSIKGFVAESSLLLSKKARKKSVITVNKENGGEFSIIRLVKGMHKHLSLKSQFSQPLDL